MIHFSINKYKYILIIIIFFSPCINSIAQLSSSYKKYVNKYIDIAINNTKKYKIPASITMAQALIESSAGMSTLSKKSNNHFGIKCNGWTGKKVYADDDYKHECFRQYNNVSESYDDHAKFLTQKSRYAKLFKLSITDYKGWAKGLQKAGYATNKFYANRLIKIIEDYQLYKFDDKRYENGPKYKIEEDKEVDIKWTHQPYKTNELVYVIAKEGDTFASIAKEFGFKEKDLLKFNETVDYMPLITGDIVYFQYKKDRSDMPYLTHKIKVGESMYSISQTYGIKIRNLYRLNKKSYEYIPEEGTILKLR